MKNEVRYEAVCYVHDTAGVNAANILTVDKEFVVGRCMVCGKPQTKAHPFLLWSDLQVCCFDCDQQDGDVDLDTRKQHGMACPQCRKSSQLFVSTRQWVGLLPGGTKADEENGAVCWAPGTGCLCKHCNWAGSVGEASVRLTSLCAWVELRPSDVIWSEALGHFGEVILFYREQQTVTYLPYGWPKDKGLKIQCPLQHVLLVGAPDQGKAGDTGSKDTNT